MVHPFGGYRPEDRRRSLGMMSVTLEIALLITTIVFFFLLDAYTTGCERI